ncbi:MAG: transposase [Longimicrobiales bacterium]
MARFLQHVLPRGFTKIRSYGLLSPSRRKDLEQARHLLDVHSSATRTTAPSAVVPAETAVRDADSARSTASVTLPGAAAIPLPRRCPVCRRGLLHFVQRFPRSRAPP